MSRISIGREGDQVGRPEVAQRCSMATEVRGCAAAISISAIRSCPVSRSVGADAGMRDPYLQAERRRDPAQRSRARLRGSRPSTRACVWADTPRTASAPGTAHCFAGKPDLLANGRPELWAIRVGSSRARGMADDRTLSRTGRLRAGYRVLRTRRARSVDPEAIEAHCGVDANPMHHRPGRMRGTAVCASCGAMADGSPIPTRMRPLV